MSKPADSDDVTDDDLVSIERREQPRVAVNLAVTMTSDSNFFVGFADNVSEGGLFVATHELLPIGDTIDLEFRLPGEDEPFCVKAEVCWHRTVSDRPNGILPGFGAQFTDLDDEDFARLQSFVEDREPLFHPE